MTTEMKPKIGSIVRYAVPVADGEQHFSRGRVVATEVYDDGASCGPRRWYYVRWYNADGRPDAEPMKHSRDELEICP